MHHCIFNDVLDKEKKLSELKEKKRKNYRINLMWFRND